MKLKIKKGDTVKVIAGADKGKSGSVLDIDKDNLRVRVQGVRVQTKVDRRENQLIKTEGYIHYSNVQLAEAPRKKTKKKAASKTA